MRQIGWQLAVPLVACIVAGAVDARFARGQNDLAGWQGLRVIRQEGMPTRMLAVDLNADGRDELLVVNTRLSRLDVYRWLAPAERQAAVAADPERPNELPLAPDWEHSEIALDQLPYDVAAADLDGDRRLELVLLAGPSLEIAVYRSESEAAAVGGPLPIGKWAKAEHWDLLPGSPAGRSLLLLRSGAQGKPEALVSMEQGLQTLSLAREARPAWLSPREARGRLDCKLADLDGDGDLDLLEWSALPRQSLRWFENLDGQLLPAQVVYELPLQAVETLPIAGRPAELLLLGGSQEGLVSRETLSKAESDELGKRDAIPLPGGPAAAWCGLMLADKPALVAVDPGQPRFRVQPLGERGWLAEQTYPTVGNVRALVAPPAKPGTLLLWIKDAGELLQSAWDGARLTYPKPFPGVDEPGERRLLAVERVGATVWWAQRIGDNVDLYVWAPGQPEPIRTRFAAIGPAIEQALWLGGARLLFKEQFQEGAKIATAADDRANIEAPAHLARVDLAEFRLVDRSAGQGATDLRPARLTEGVLQWLGDDLQPTDQIMLDDGQRLASYAALPNGEAWALEQTGAFIHRLRPDAGGISRVAQSHKMNGGAALSLDPVLGMMLVSDDRAVRLSQGQPWELKLLEKKDSRLGRPSGVKEATIHRLLSADVTGDAIPETVVCDDGRHQLTVWQRGDDGLKPLLSWQVFEDQSYPYGGGARGGQVGEPRALVAFDADGDKLRELAMLCHDRLLLYIAREQQP